MRSVYARLISDELDLGAVAALALGALTRLALLAMDHPALAQGCMSRRAGHGTLSGALLRGCWTLLEEVSPVAHAGID